MSEKTVKSAIGNPSEIAVNFFHEKKSQKIPTFLYLYTFHKVF